MLVAKTRKQKNDKMIDWNELCKIIIKIVKSQPECLIHIAYIRLTLVLPHNAQNQMAIRIFRSVFFLSFFSASFPLISVSVCVFVFFVTDFMLFVYKPVHSIDTRSFFG